MSSERRLNLALLEGRFAICRLGVNEPVPAWVLDASGFIAFVRTSDELSVLCQEKILPANMPSEPGWRMFMVEGPLDFAITGILLALAKPLSDAGLSILAISTFGTDYLLVKEEALESAVHGKSQRKYRVDGLDLWVLGSPGGGRQFCDALDRNPGEAGKDSSQVVACR